MPLVGLLENSLPRWTSPCQLPDNQFTQKTVQTRFTVPDCQQSRFLPSVLGLLFLPYSLAQSTNWLLLMWVNNLSAKQTNKHDLTNVSGLFFDKKHFFSSWSHKLDFTVNIQLVYHILQPFLKFYICLLSLFNDTGESSNADSSHHPRPSPPPPTTGIPHLTVLLSTGTTANSQCFLSGATKNWAASPLNMYHI